MGKAGRIDVAFVCGGDFHDMDGVRVEMLKILHDDGHRRRVKVLPDFSDTETLKSADAIVTYTVNVMPTPEQVKVMDDFVSSGKRMFATHGTNSVIEFTPEGKVNCPRTHQDFFKLLGSQFVAHPPIMDFDVKNEKPDHPIVKGVPDFVANDELYLSEFHADVEVLLSTSFSGMAQEGFVEDDWTKDDPSRPVMYLRKRGEGEILYYTLGHLRSTYDMQPWVEEYPVIERGPWDTPEHYTLLRRGIDWATGMLET